LSRFNTYRAPEHRRRQEFFRQPLEVVVAFGNAHRVLHQIVAVAGIGDEINVRGRGGQAKS